MVDGTPDISKQLKTIHDCVSDFLYIVNVALKGFSPEELQKHKKSEEKQLKKRNVRVSRSQDSIKKGSKSSLTQQSTKLPGVKDVTSVSFKIDRPKETASSSKDSVTTSHISIDESVDGEKINKNESNQ